MLCAALVLDTRCVSGSPYLKETEPYAHRHERGGLGVNPEFSILKILLLSIEIATRLIRTSFYLSTL